MKYIYGERVSGKTIACLEMCRKENAYLVVSTLRQKHNLKKIAETEKYEDVIPRIISYNDYQELKINSQIGNKKFVLDEARDILFQIFGDNLIGFSETIRDFPEENYKYLKSLMSPQTRTDFFQDKDIIFKPYYDWE